MHRKFISFPLDSGLCSCLCTSEYAGPIICVFHGILKKESSKLIPHLVKPPQLYIQLPDSPVLVCNAGQTGAWSHSGVAGLTRTHHFSVGHKQKLVDVLVFQYLSLFVRLDKQFALWSCHPIGNSPESISSQVRYSHESPLAFRFLLPKYSNTARRKAHPKPTYSCITATPKPAPGHKEQTDPRLNTRRGKDTKALELGFLSDKTHNVRP